MYIIPPITIQPTDVVETNVTITVLPAWNSTTTYVAGQSVSYGGNDWTAKFTNATSVDVALGALTNTNRTPGSTIPGGYYYAGQQWWSLTPYAKNCYKMFSDNPDEYTEKTGIISVLLKPTQSFNAVCLFNVNAYAVAIFVRETESLESNRLYVNVVTLTYENPLHPDFLTKTVVAFVDIPYINKAVYPDAHIDIRLFGADDTDKVQCGSVIIGTGAKIGTILYGTSTGISDNSRKETNFDGSLTIIERGYSDIVNYQVEVESKRIFEIRRLLATRRAKLTAYVGYADAPETIIYGIFNDFSIPREKPLKSIMSIDIKSIVQDTPVTPLVTNTTANITLKLFAQSTVGGATGFREVLGGASVYVERSIAMNALGMYIVAVNSSGVFLQLSELGTGTITDSDHSKLYLQSVDRTLITTAAPNGGIYHTIAAIYTTNTTATEVISLRFDNTSTIMIYIV